MFVHLTQRHAAIFVVLSRRVEIMDNESTSMLFDISDVAEIRDCRTL